MSLDEIQNRLNSYDRMLSNYMDKVRSDYVYHSDDAYPSSTTLYHEAIDAMMEYEFSFELDDERRIVFEYEFAVCSLLMTYSEARSYKYYPAQTPLIRELSRKLRKLGYRVVRQVQPCDEIWRYFLHNYTLETLNRLYVSKIVTEEEKSMVWEEIKFRSKNAISWFREELMKVTAQPNYYFKYCLDEEEKQEHGFTEEEMKTLFGKPVFKYSERRELFGH